MANLIATDELDGKPILLLFDDGTTQKPGNGILPATQATRDRANSLLADRAAVTRKMNIDQARIELRKIAAGTSVLAPAAREKFIAQVLLRLVNEAIQDNSVNE